MKLILKDGEAEIELKEITKVNEDYDIIIIKLIDTIRHEDIEKMEQYLSDKLCKKVVLLNPIFGEVLGI